ncbi:MAG: YkgJ family cysteine cluster protein [Dissulfurimicrobium sp.]|uniref:YkgJ family cysteine cluster protein n=1 Tax=Dissulfurimicrobium TaxID=1769732 RepID=UPI003C71ED84
MDLKKPLWPLFEFVTQLYLISPHGGLEDLIQELPDDLKLLDIIYKQPSMLIRPIASVFDNLALIKKGRDITLPDIRDEDGKELPLFDAMISLTKQRVLEYELEAINSALCGPCSCVLCCTGPDLSARQEFFEIPLLEEEISLFSRFPIVDSMKSRAKTAYSEPELEIDGAPFYKRPSAIYHWATGYSLILVRGAACPHLNASGSCNIYSSRPVACRKPQIFPFVIERLSGRHQDAAERYLRRDALLAIWDCPYVKEFKAEIITYARLCNLTCIFKENKA